MGRRITVPTENDTYQAQLRWHIVQRGYSYKEIAGYLGFTVTYVKRFLALPGSTTYGHAVVQPRVLNRLCDMLYLTKDQRHRVNTLAARSAGYQL